MPPLIGIPPQQPVNNGRQLAENVILPALSVLETILTAKASKGQHVTTSARDLLKGVSATNERDRKSKGEALDRALRKQVADAQIGGIESRAAGQKLQQKKFDLDADKEKTRLAGREGATARLLEIQGITDPKKKMSALGTFLASGKGEFLSPSSLKFAQQGTKPPEKPFSQRTREELAVQSAVKALLEGTKVKGTIAKDLASAGVNLSKVASIFTILAQKKKAQLQEGGKLLGTDSPVPDIVKGGVKQLGAKAKIKEFKNTEAFAGQKTETASALIKIITGQNRFVESLFNKIRQSLPDETDGKEFSITKIEQSIQNAYGLFKAARDFGIEEKIQLASETELADSNSTINQTLASMTPKELTPEDVVETNKIINQVLKGFPGFIPRPTTIEGVGTGGLPGLGAPLPEDQSIADEVFQ